MERYISSSIGLSGADKIIVNKLLNELERFDSGIKSVSVFITKEAKGIKSIVELSFRRAGLMKKIIKKSNQDNLSVSLRESLGKVKKKLVSIVIKRAKAA